MKNIIRLLCSVVAFILLSGFGNAYAGEKTVYSSDESIYASYFDLDTGLPVYQGTDFTDNLRIMVYVSKESKKVDGSFTYPNYDNTRLGVWDLQWVFTPSDSKYETLSGTIKVNVIIPTGGKSASEDNDEAVPEFYTPDVTLEPGTSYYMPLSNTISGSEYTWTTSDKTIAKINKKTGKIIAKKSGTVTIKCKVDTPYDETYTLSTKVTVKAKKITNNLQSVSGGAIDVSDKTITMTKGDKANIGLSYDTSTTTVQYKSSKSSVARVEDYTGEVTAKKSGTAYITCTMINTKHEVTVIRYKVIVN